MKNKWKMLNMELASWLEEKWRNDVRRVFLDDFMEVSAKFISRLKPCSDSL